jgi:hypothetical protein
VVTILILPENNFFTAEIGALTESKILKSDNRSILQNGVKYIQKVLLLNQNNQ